MLDSPMKYFPTLLCLAFSVAISQVAFGDSAKAQSVTGQITPLPFQQVTPLPGAISLSKDGRRAAHIKANGDIVLWDSASLKQLQSIPSSDKKPSTISLNQDGSIIAIGYLDGRLIIFSLADKKPIREFLGHSGQISALAFSPDEKILASGASDSTVQLWDISSGKRLNIFDSLSDGWGGSGTPVSIGFSGNGKALFVNEWYSRQYDVERGISILDIETGIDISTRNVAPPNSDDTMRTGQAIGGGGWLLTYTGGLQSNKSGLMVERLDTCAPPRRLASGGFADTVAADPLARWVAATDDQQITFYAVENPKKIYAIKLPAKMIALVPQPDGRSLFALKISDTQQNGNRWIFERDAETVTGSTLYRIPVPKVLWNAPPLSIKADAAHCPPTEETRRQQDFKVPDKPAELKATAKLVVSKAALTDPNQLTGEYEWVYPVRDLYFAQNDELYALYIDGTDWQRGISSFSGRAGVGVWNLLSNKLIRGNFDSNSAFNIIRLREGWGTADKNLNKLLTGERFSNISNADDKEHYLSLISDLETGEFFRQFGKNIQRYNAKGKRMQDIKLRRDVLAYAARNGQIAAIFKNGHVEVWQLTQPIKYKSYQLGIEFDKGNWPGEMLLSADGQYLQIEFPYTGEGPPDYVTYHLKSTKSVGSGPMLTPFPRHANRGVVEDVRPHRLAVWDYDNAKIIARLPRQRSRDKNGEYHPLKAAISDDGRLIASASVDGLIRVWDIDHHQMIGQARTNGEVTAITFDSNGQRLAAGQKDGQIIVFQIPARNQ